MISGQRSPKSAKIGSKLADVGPTRAGQPNLVKIGGSWAQPGEFGAIVVCGQRAGVTPKMLPREVSEERLQIRSFWPVQRKV